VSPPTWPTAPHFLVAGLFRGLFRQLFLSAGTAMPFYAVGSLVILAPGGSLVYTLFGWDVSLWLFGLVGWLGGGF